jgi:hypothetical protein
LLRAFRGELVSQDFGDEPAATLIVSPDPSRRSPSPPRPGFSEAGR